MDRGVEVKAGLKCFASSGAETLEGFLKNRSTCAYCEYFDGGGEAAVRRAQTTGSVLQGDCLNSRSPRFQTSGADTCPEFLEA